MNWRMKMKYKLGEKLNPDGLITVTKRGRLAGNIGEDPPCAVIICTIEEIEKVIKSAKQFRKSKTFKDIKKKFKVKDKLYFRNLSPDVTFGFLNSNRHPILCKRKKRTK
jgi:hypothetical protein